MSMGFLLCTLISMLLFIGFNAIGIKKFGLLSCYSAYGEKWIPLSPANLNIWSVVTIISALLLVPPMLATAVGSPIQFISFFAPLYLILVGLTPDYNSTNKKNIIHQIGAWGCVIGILIWLFAIVHEWVVILPVFVLMFVIAFGTRTFKESCCYYLEMGMYLATYLVLIF